MGIYVFGKEFIIVLTDLQGYGLCAVHALPLLCYHMCMDPIRRVLLPSYRYMLAELNIKWLLRSLLIVMIISTWRCSQPSNEPNIEIADHEPEHALLRTLATKVVISADPPFAFGCDTMRVGVIQHLDRNYTYDVVPEELENGLLFQGIHRPAKGTTLKIEVVRPVRIYFFFHTEVDGGYGKIFDRLPNWTKCERAPAYDIRNGDHGMHMTMYKIDANVGTLLIPATTQDKACFNMVIVDL